MTFPLIILAGFVVAALAPFVQRRFGRFAGWILAVYPLSVFIVSLDALIIVSEGGSLPVALPWISAIDIPFSFYIDGLAVLFALLISGIGVLVVLYSQSYLKGHPQLPRFSLYLLLFMSSMLGVVLADNVIVLFIFWELTSLTSYFLIGFNHEQERSRKAALQALLVTGAGGLALLAGLLLAAQIGGSLELSAILSRGELVVADPLYTTILILLLLGAFTKSAQFPFHFWLPSAMEAPTPVSAYLHSATMVKAGIYLLARVHPVIGDTEVSHYLITVVGTVTMVFGATIALMQRDLKRILAYTTVSALGMLTLLLGLGTTPATEAAMVFLLVHSLYKGAMFLIAGAVDHETGTRDLEELGGLSRAMPITAGAALFAGLSMAGLPPMLGFISKELLYEAKLGAPSAAWLITSLGVLSNVLIVASAGLLVLRLFFGRLPATPKTPHEAPPTMLAGPVVLALLGFLIGLFPEAVSAYVITPAVSAVRAEPTVVTLALWHGINPVLALSVITVLSGVGLYLVHRPVRHFAWRLKMVSWLKADQWYDATVEGMLKVADVQTRILQSGFLRRYLLIILLTTLGLGGWALFSEPGLLDDVAFPEAQLHEVLLVGVMIGATLLAVQAKSRLTAIVALGIVGYGMAILFILFSSPDLAMTQFAIETLTVILFVLVVYRLPRFSDYSKVPSRVRDAAVAVVVGSFMTVFVAAVLALPHWSHVSAYLVEKSWPLAKGRNIVNVILVDFRGLDTLGEITVLAVAGIGAYALLKLKMKKEE